MAGFWLAMVSAILMALPGPLAGQDQPFSLKVDVSLVSVDVVAYDSKGDSVPNLTKEDFLVLEDGEPQEIQHLETTEAPYNTLLLFDVSGSTNSQSRFMLNAANRFLASLRMQDQVAIASFDTDVTKLLDWRTRLGASQQVVLPFKDRGTNVYSALEWAVRELDKISGRKGVIVLTDGFDQRIGSPRFVSNEEREFDRVLKAVEKSRSPFYFVALDLPGLPASRIDEIRGRLEGLAKHSGGRVLYPRTIQDIATLYEGIARQLGASYSIAYASNHPAQDGTFRRIEVRSKRRDLRLSQSREGYYANGGQPQQPPATSSAILAPVLITPIARALLSSPDKNEWRFSWEDVAGATKYQITINAPDSGTPFLEAETRGARYVVNNKSSLAGRSLKGWTWRVRAHGADGSWGPWSEVRPFDVFQ